MLLKSIARFPRIPPEFRGRTQYRTAGCLVAGEPLDEELAKGGAPRPVVATRKRRPRERERGVGGGRSGEAKEKRKVRPR